MKKILCIAIIVVCLMSVFACTHSDEIQQLQEQINQLQAENEQLRIDLVRDNNATNNNSKVSNDVSNDAINDVSNDSSGDIVYWVRNGKVWHTTPDCQSLARSNNIYSGTIEESGKSRCCKKCG